MVAVKLKSNPKLLIVDDEPNNHRVYERTLAALDIDFIKVFFRFPYEFRFQTR